MKKLFILLLFVASVCKAQEIKVHCHQKLDGSAAKVLGYEELKIDSTITKTIINDVKIQYKNKGKERTKTSSSYDVEKWIEREDGTIEVHFKTADRVEKTRISEGKLYAFMANEWLHVKHCSITN
ncbi:hypothetical protein [Vibrio nigripulchritudo]|uniref:hypothetical protein n=1 Tax=Vibrio nigripulchritudo TaxID=28173 RepID=UPI0003B22900|nr:hypothetical protein [Vibrio nigripulchritudo]CCN73364.1 exported hypothetical protein [Vibrio nigripulchritudo SFn118]